MAAGKAIGRILGRRWTKTLVAFSAAILAAATIGVGTAHADDPIDGTALAAQIEAETTAAVNTAMAESSDALAHVDVHVTSPATATSGSRTAEVFADPTAGGTGASPGEPAPPVEVDARPGASRKLEPRKNRPRTEPQVRGRSTERNAAARPEPALLLARPGAALRSASGTSTAPRHPRRPAAPSRPPAPLSPTTPAPGNPGVS